MQLFIELTRPASWFKPVSSLIQLVEATDYSHVRLRWVTSSGINIIYEASGSEIKFLGEMAQSKHPVHVIKYYMFNLTDIEKRRLVRICLKYAGIKYGKLQLIGMWPVRLFKLKRNPLSSGRWHQICVEITARILDEALNMNTGLKYDIIGLKELEEYLDEQQKRKNI